ncbi:MAG: two-component system sensor histidine kinase NtrB [Burkholderiales bacterium]
MKDRHPRPGDPVALPIFWEPSVAFLRWTIVLILGSCAAFMIVLFIVAPEQMRTAPAGGPVVLALVAMAAMVFLSRGKIKTSVYVLGIGLWLYATGISLLLGGLNSMFIIVYPLIIMGAGWLLRPRLAEVRKLGAEGGPLRSVGTTQDITERKQVEARQVQLEAQKMEALGTLAGGLAHDFNDIVASIMGNVELARQEVGPGHAARESLEEIRKASRRAKELVQQILAFGRRQAVSREVISLAPVVEESARVLRTTLHAGVRLSVECAPDAPPVLADATQVQQMLRNLCANAWEAMQGQERPAAIELSLVQHMVNGASYAGPERRTRGARVALRPGRYACLTVRDTGPGMDQATRSRMFEPFFTTKPVGTGLGLAVVHGIAHSYGASIEVKSVPGKGATFRIYFPAAQAPALPA